MRARSVVVASGGFQANLAWLKEAWGPAAENFLIRGTPYEQGTMLRNLISKGVATVGDPTQGHAVAIDARAPKFDGGIATRLDCVPFSIVVNRDAQRFYDEGEDLWPKRYAIWGRLVAHSPTRSPMPSWMPKPKGCSCRRSSPRTVPRRSASWRSSWRSIRPR